MSKLSQEEFDDMMKDAEVASCPDGEPHMFIERLKFIHKRCIYSVGECERCHEFDWHWTDSQDPPTKVGKDGKVEL